MYDFKTRMTSRGLLWEHSNEDFLLDNKDTVSTGFLDLKSLCRNYSELELAVAKLLDENEDLIPDHVDYICTTSHPNDVMFAYELSRQLCSKVWIAKINTIGENLTQDDFIEEGSICLEALTSFSIAREDNLRVIIEKLTKIETIGCLSIANRVKSERNRSLISLNFKSYSGIDEARQDGLSVTYCFSKNKIRRKNLEIALNSSCTN